MNKKNKRGFTLIELLVVIAIIGILVAIAVPGIMGISSKMKQRSLTSKLESLEQAAVIFAQNNSNKIKSALGGDNGCTVNSVYCECPGYNYDDKYTSSDCKYKFKMKVIDLVDSGAYKSEDSTGCYVRDPSKDPKDSDSCLDCVDILVKIDDDYKNSTAEIDLEDKTKVNGLYDIKLRLGSNFRWKGVQKTCPR